MYARLVNERYQNYKSVKVGFSWTEMFFGFWTALFRGDLKWCFILALAEIIFGAFTWSGGAFLVTFIFAFFYNPVYVKDLIFKGYKPADQTSYNILRSHGYLPNN
ncbi:DUF2628 domain-containing protein [Companilactobacillus musae]|uniref:DUF2628 domain-containing protein n=1 Tax=Companilactobacillus musae TaxID=1903258 RepID=UPI000E64D96A|nr:DUF2628 domain-containing protein [Companilactobacillus musae]